MTLTEAVDTLRPLTLRQLTALFKKENITGTKRSCFGCVVAQYLKKTTGLAISVELEAKKAVAFRKGYDEEVLPDNVYRWIENFDAGKYPQLEEAV
jgi:hypothetical protein